MITRKHEGFTLVEILVAMVVGGLVAAAAYSLFFTTNRSSQTQEDVSEAQQNVRIAMERVSRDIRTAGFGLPQPPFSLSIDGTSFTSPVTVTNSSTGPDTITLLGIGYKAGVLKKSGATDCNEAGNTMICLDDVLKFENNDGDFMDSRVYVSVGGVEFIQLLPASGQDVLPKLKISGSSLTGTYADSDDIPVYIIQAIEYSIVTSDPPEGCSPQNPCLVSKDFTSLRGSGHQVLADGIEDLQFAYGIDLNPRDGKIDYAGSYDDADFLNDPGDPTSIVAVRVNVVGRTQHIDPNGNEFSHICVEDRSSDAGCTAASDGYRRRSLSSLVKIRNPRTGS